MKRIVITGMGAITPIGNDPGKFWKNLLKGKSGAGALTLFDAGEMPYNIACEVKGFDARQYMDRKFIRRTARATQFCRCRRKAGVDRRRYGNHRSESG